jgi:16S rRNA (cytidine1402-2'-O)-methyltransferase
MEHAEPGTLYVISTPIGNLEDITRRAVRLLSEIDLVAAEDTRKTRVLFDHLEISKPMVSFQSYNEVRRVSELVGSLASGKSVGLVTDAGTPGISDPAYSLVRAAIEHGHHVVALPGPSAVLPALVLSGLSMDRFVFEGFLPTKKGRRTRLEELRLEKRTVVFYESPFRIVRTLQELLASWGDRRVSVSREITKKFEETVRGTITEVLGELKKKPVRGEYVLVVEGSSPDRRQ